MDDPNDDNLEPSEGEGEDDNDFTDDDNVDEEDVDYFDAMHHAAEVPATAAPARWRSCSASNTAEGRPGCVALRPE